MTEMEFRPAFADVKVGDELYCLVTGVSVVVAVTDTFFTVVNKASPGLRYELTKDGRAALDYEVTESIAFWVKPESWPKVGQRPLAMTIPMDAATIGSLYYIMRVPVLNNEPTTNTGKYAGVVRVYDNSNGDSLQPRLEFLVVVPKSYLPPREITWPWPEATAKVTANFFTHGGFDWYWSANGREWFGLLDSTKTLQTEPLKIPV